MIQRIYFHLFMIEETSEREYKSDHGFPNQKRSHI
jgi:hypothetical protein